MSIKIYDTQTGQWIKGGSALASSINIIDLEGNFQSNNVNEALRELATSITKLKSDVKYIYENGTIGGGSGGGGAATPIVTIDGDKEIIVNSDDIINIYYYYTSPNPGDGYANLSYGTNITQVSIPQGRNRWTVGPFPRGTHNLTISVKDKQGFWTTPVTIKVISGSLEIQSSFNDSKDFTLNEEVIIPFEVLTSIPEAVFIDYNFNGVSHTIPANIGANELNLGVLPYMGVNSISMKARNSGYTSNELKFTLVATDALNLFTSTTFDKVTVEVGKNVLIDYRVSMKQQYSFKSEYWIDGNRITTVNSYPGVNFWNVGNNLDLGHHVLQIKTKTVDGVHSSELTIEFDVVSVGFEPYRHVRTGLWAEFSAIGKVNNSSNESVWEDKSGNNIACRLHNFNYLSNGWIDNTLVMSGKSYAEIDLRPFVEGVKTGFTLDILCKIENVGNINAKIISCKNPVTPYQGFEIDTWKSNFSTSRSEKVESQIQDNTWTKITYVVDRTNRLMTMYINGIISSVATLNANDLSQAIYSDEFIYDGKIILGAGKDIDGQIVNNSVSAIKSLRIYRRSLNDDEILQNFIADIDDEEEQMKIRDLNTSTDGMPTISFVGNFESMDENSERISQISYNDPQDPSKTFVKDGCLISWQGTSSKNYPVKNWTMKLRDGGNPTVNYAPKDNWRAEDRWTLKANYMDSSHANNVGTQKFVYDFFKPYPYPSQIAEPTTRSNVDGFPVRLIINGEDAGIYTWNIDRYAFNNYGFGTYNENGTKNRHPNAVSYEIGVNGTTGAAAFKDDSWESIRAEFDSRYNYRGEESDVTEAISLNGVSTRVLKAGMHNELQALVSWVVNANDEQFRSELEEHFSKRHLIDYYLIAYVFGMVDNLGKNMVLTTWGQNDQGNTIWYPSFYDCDSLFGLNNSGIIAFDAGLDMANGDYNTSNSKLWTQLTKMFENEIRERYIELRLSRNIDGVTHPPIFSYENIMNYLGDEVMDQIGQKYYNQDARIKYVNSSGLQWLYACNGARREFTERWLKERFTYMDSVYQFNYDDKKTVIRSYARGQLTLRVKTYSPQWILISFSDAANTKMKLYVGKEHYTNFSMYVDNGTDNNIEIYGCHNIMYLDGIKDLDVRSVNVAQAEKLVELDISNSNRIEELALGNNRYLQKVLVNNCTNLGYQVTNRTLDVSNCPTLKEFDCSNTHIANVMFNPNGGVLERLDCSNTDITTFTLNGQEYLTALSLNGCDDLSELTITNCNGVRDVTMIDTKLTSVIINGCENLDLVDISYTKSLRQLDLNGCPNLRVLKMAGVSNPAITDLNLTYALNLEELDISSSGYIETITFGRYTDEGGILRNYNKLKKLYCQFSSLKSIRYGATSVIPDYLDLAGLNLEYIDFESCTNVREIRNINLTMTGGSPFNNCYNLRSIQGRVKLIGGASRTFYNCKLLTTLPTLDLSEVTSMTETFRWCYALTMSNVRQVMINSGITNKFTSSYQVFHSCTGITGALPEDLFSRCTALTSINEFFVFCSKISGTLPANILKPMPNLMNTRCSFTGTAISGELPRDLLRYNTQLLSAERMFESTKITYVDLNNLFSYNSKLNNVQGMFNSCTSLNVVPTENMFLYNRDLSLAGNFFKGCRGVTGRIPQNIFNNIPKDAAGNNKLSNIESFFEGTNITGTIPAYISPTQKGLFDSSPLLSNVANLFKGCTGLTGSIPVDLFKYNNNLTLVNGLFDGCTNIGDPTNNQNIPPNLLRGKTRITNVGAMFKNCTNLYSTIPVGFLNDCPAITNAYEIFYGCTNLSGEIPRRISTWSKGPSPIDPSIEIDIETVHQYGLFDKCTELVSIAGAFNNCINLQGEIPPTLLMNATKVTNTGYMFYRCYKLYGPIPSELFKNCINLQITDGMFQDCVGLYNYIVDEEKPYAIPEDLFVNNPNLTDVYRMFCMISGSLPHSSKLNGKIPPTLFNSCPKLANISDFMYGCGSVTGELDSNLFRVNTKLANATYAFASTGITSIGSGLFSTCVALKNLSYTFANCSSLTGNTPEFWSESHTVKATSFAGCFRNATGLTNYNAIPAGWK